MSTPLWYVEAPDVGAFLFPKYEFILVYPGVGHKKPSEFKSIISPIKCIRYRNYTWVIWNNRNKKYAYKKYRNNYYIKKRF